ncbi:hypothetical protein [Mucilaginibacter sp. FT3.2]|uniref:hypothetical protein n=1 Tax=Mucilaginibacter sp. FT3.2 TaxID=2723090 RepID=UPI00160F1599|nr:hypothetical protein [Mucilaginibacter sp. FT3.2]MBB6231145.1 hypothetical protein [Mucilaginibacter sp. FT3.2]
MDQITPEQLNTLAQQFLDMGNAILSYRENNQAIIGDNDADLEITQNELLDKAGQLAMLSAIASGPAAATAISKLIAVNVQITGTIKNLAEVQQVIDIASAALKVVTSVISLNANDIIDSIGGLSTACGITI